MPSVAATPAGWNLRVLGSTGLNGRGDAMHVNVQNGYAYIGHMGYSGAGTSIVDVRDPEHPRVVRQIDAPEGTRSHKVQVIDDILVVNHERNPFAENVTRWSAGLQIYDIRRPDDPTPIGFLPTTGIGVHRPTYWTPPYVFFSGSADGFSDQILIIADLSDPSRPREVGRWWLPGMHIAGGETPSWSADRRSACHHALVRDDRAYIGWWDSGFVILDIGDLSRPRLVAHVPFDERESSCTHTVLPVPGKDLLIVTDEAVRHDPPGLHKKVRVINIADELAPKQIATFPIPEGDFEDRGGKFGPHNLHEMRPGTYSSADEIFLTYTNAGVRIVDIRDPFAPREVAYYVPEAPPGRPAIHMNDLTVDRDGRIYATDRFAGGLYILERTG
jgi:hypothetical protein